MNKKSLVYFIVILTIANVIFSNYTNINYKEIKMKIHNSEYPQSLLNLMDDNEEAADFVIDYIDNKNKPIDIDISEDVNKGKIPLFLQWDERWGYQNYGDDFFAINGCGPTCLSMIVTGLTGSTKWNPYKVGCMAESSGYYVKDKGTAWSFMVDGAEELGVHSENIFHNKSMVLEKLKKGIPLIAIMGPGEFTSGGHFIVLKGLSKEGKVIINDPNSVIKSKKTWDIEVIMKQAQNFWCYTTYN